MSDPERLVPCPSLVSGDHGHAALAPAGTRLVRTAGVCPLDERGVAVGVGGVAA